MLKLSCLFSFEMNKLLVTSIVVNILLCISKIVVYVITQSSLILTDSFDSLLNASVLLLNLYNPTFTPLVNYSAIASYRTAFIFVSIDALVKQVPLEEPKILLIASCSMVGVGLMLVSAQILSTKVENQKMIIIATINDNSSTVGAIISSSVCLGTGDGRMSGILDNSLNVCICLIFTIFSIFKIVEFLKKNAVDPIAVEKELATLD